MKKIPIFWGIHAQPRGILTIVLPMLLFIVAIFVYQHYSSSRLEANPSDKLMPSFSKMVDAFQRVAFEEDRRSGEHILWEDTKVSLTRVFKAVAVATTLSLFFGIILGVFRGPSTIGTPFLVFLSNIPPLALLPIIFITFGVDELGKMMLIIIGVTPMMIRSIQLAVEKLPGEQKVKACTLGLTQWQYICSVVLPQTMPNLIHTLRYSFGAVWVYMIAAEAIAAQAGLGYRIFLVRRYLSMEVIIPYVLWITLIGFLVDVSLKLTLRFCYRWFEENSH